MQTSAGLEAEIAGVARVFEAARAELGRVLVGQRAMVDRLLIGLLADGHVLVEGVPGLAKTTAIRSLAATLDLSFSRVQFTPDLLPADLLGTQVYNPREGTFSTRPGPIFANLVLADEINRAPAKVQSALLEAMQERQVTLDKTYPLPRPFLVMATQNPIEQEGTYALPEAQVDRFLLKVVVHYPSRDEELEVVARASQPEHPLGVVASAAELQKAQQLTRSVHASAPLRAYIVDLVRATREPGRYDKKLAAAIEHGASPRASIALDAAARAVAFLSGRAYVLPEDVRVVAPDVLRHRVALGYDAEADGLSTDAVINRLLDVVPVP
jgi:MoxR-like ATPase